MSGEAAFKLYLYLLANQDKYVDNFSPANFSKEFGVSADRCRKVFSQLEEAGYLVCCGKNEYQFYEEPQKKPQITIARIEIKKYVSIDNEDTALTYREFYEIAKAEDWTDKEIDDTWADLRVVV